MREKSIRSRVAPFVKFSIVYSYRRWSYDSFKNKNRCRHLTRAKRRMKRHGPYQGPNFQGKIGRRGTLKQLTPENRSHTRRARENEHGKALRNVPRNGTPSPQDVWFTRARIRSVSGQ